MRIAYRRIHQPITFDFCDHQPITFDSSVGRILGSAGYAHIPEKNTRYFHMDTEFSRKGNSSNLFRHSLQDS